MSFDFQAWLKPQQNRVEKLLEARIASLASAPAKLTHAMGYSLLGGGKRLRPILCLAFADAVARESGGGGVVADDGACALEAIHTYSLIHDDLPSMDDDDLRRGQPTSHKAFGEAMAILAGDALLTDAFTWLATGLGPTQPLRARMVAELARSAGAQGMVGGQVLDIADDRPAQLDYLLKLHRMKTGALIRAACVLGAMAGGGSEPQIGAAASYGEALGLAFQIADDVLDQTSTAEQLGKPVKADSAAGRFTFPAVVGLEKAKAMAREEASRAKHALSSIEPEAGPLHALADYAVERAV